MLFFKKAMPTAFYCQTRLQQLPYIQVKETAYNILESPKVFHRRVLDLIASAGERILITALYLQDDASGREILDALYEAKRRKPHLHVRVYVDFHRAQRGLIGQASSAGNCELYYRKARNVENPPAVYGVPVKRREIFGVMHLKGFVFDNTVLYSGASLNDIYLGAGERYRLDRYHEIESRDLADVMCAYVTNAFHKDFAVQDFSQGPVTPAKDLRDQIKKLRRHLTQVQYAFKGGRLHKDGVGVCPIAGLGKKHNALNRNVLRLLGGARDNLFICTPYFNPPKIFAQAFDAALERGIKITIIVGDKTANDFFIRSGEKFSTVGAVPYIYERNLRRFMRERQKYISNGQLDIRLWRDGDNTYHVKGIFMDQNYALITGNNLNPRAWALDLENGLVIHDPHHLLSEKFRHEQQFLLRHTTSLKSAEDLESFEDYPEEVQRLLRKVKHLKASVFIKQLI